MAQRVLKKRSILKRPAGGSGKFLGLKNESSKCSCDLMPLPAERVLEEFRSCQPVTNRILEQIKDRGYWPERDLQRLPEWENLVHWQSSHEGNFAFSLIWQALT